MSKAPPMVLDASALLAFLSGEPGGESVGPLLLGASVSAVNHAETLRKLIAGGLAPERAASALRELGYRVHPFGESQALLAASLFPATRRLGLSLADRACLALGVELKQAVTTADRVWAELVLDLEIRLIR